MFLHSSCWLPPKVNYNLLRSSKTCSHCDKIHMPILKCCSAWLDSAWKLPLRQSQDVCANVGGKGSDKTRVPSMNCDRKFQDPFKEDLIIFQTRISNKPQIQISRLFCDLNPLHYSARKSHEKPSCKTFSILGHSRTCSCPCCWEDPSKHDAVSTIFHCRYDICQVLNRMFGAQMSPGQQTRDSFSSWLQSPSDDIRLSTSSLSYSLCWGQLFQGRDTTLLKKNHLNTSDGQHLARVEHHFPSQALQKCEFAMMNI